MVLGGVVKPSVLRPQRLHVMTSDLPLREYEGSWRELVAMFDRLSASGKLADWDSPDDYKASLSTKSVTMASLVLMLQPIYSDRTVVGAGIFGLVISVNREISQLNNHMITLCVGPNKRIQVGLMGHGPHNPTAKPIEHVHCDIANVTDEIDRFLEFLIAESNG